MEGGSLTEILKVHYQSFSEEFCKYTIWCIAMGIKAIHDKNVLHRDMKSDNVLIDPKGNIKVSDLGTAVALDE